MRGIEHLFRPYPADLRTEAASRRPGDDFVLCGRRYVVAFDRKPIEVSELAPAEVRAAKRAEVWTLN